MEKTIYVGFGEYKISGDPDTILTALGLGSCVAVTFYCPVSKLGGMVHVVLPSSDGHLVAIPGKYADTGISILLEDMIKSGAQRDKLITKMVGGAEILKYYYPTESLEIGKKNLAACNNMLKTLNITIQGEETGGVKGRSVKLYVATGKIIVRNMDGEREI